MIAPADEFLVISAARYAMGRRSYIVGMTVDWIIAYRKRLSPNTLSVLSRDVHEALGYEQKFPGHLGGEMDVREWRRLADALPQEPRHD